MNAPQMNFEDTVSAHVRTYLYNNFGQHSAFADVAFGPTRKGFRGECSLNVFAYAKAAGMAPAALAEALGQSLKDKGIGVAHFEVVQGFLNIEIEMDTLLSILSEDGYQPPKPAAPRRMMVEFSSPNTNKPQHLGHVRNNLLGASVSNILKAAGHHVTRVTLVNDRGIHICKSMLAWMREPLPRPTPQSTGIKGDHLVGDYYVQFSQDLKAQVAQMVADGHDEKTAERQAPLMMEAQEMLRQWESGDPEIMHVWRTMNGWVLDGFKQTYAQLGVDFDRWQFESQTYLLGKEIVQTGLQRGAFTKRDDGSVWVDLAAENLDEKLLLRSDGTSVYMTQDLGTAQERFDEDALDGCIYVVGSEQEYHFKVLKAVFARLGEQRISKGIEHLSYGMIELPDGKMKSREGTVVDADDLMDKMLEEARTATETLGKTEGQTAAQLAALHRTIGLGALKYFLLKVDPKKKMIFNPKESIELQGNTGPFIQYTHARIKRMLRRAEAEGIDVAGFSTPASLSTTERELLALLSREGKAVQAAAAALSPALVANHLYELAQSYNRFYQEVPIFGSDDAPYKLRLSQAVAASIARLLGLLGIDAPEQM